MHAFHRPALVWLLGLLIVCQVHAATPSDPLPSWNNGPSKQAIVKFVTETTQQGSANFVDPAERIAVFDNDGTLWGMGEWGEWGHSSFPSFPSFPSYLCPAAWK